jgi:bifunctional DNA-binding transcriptional regulator/antitoxin component of YhaV-PrlF toxin-antitoxin module
MQESQVGSKGELFPPKAMREKLGLKPCTKVVYTLEAGRLIVEPVPTVAELLKEKPSVLTSMDEFQKERKELSRMAET